VIAGYPWFTDWGRDTMIALPGLLIARGFLDLAREVLEGFLTHLDGGLGPNQFPDAAGPAEYNTADATLFMFHAVHVGLQPGVLLSFIYVFVYRGACSFVEPPLPATLTDYPVAPFDGLLVVGEAGPSRTWMATRLNGLPVSPGRGKPVEVNALWFNA